MGQPANSNVPLLFITALRPPPYRREGQWTIRTIQPHYRVVLIFKRLKLRNNEVIDGVKNGSAWTLLYYLNICNSVAITVERTRWKMQYSKIFKSNKSEWKNKVTVLRQSFKSHLSKFNYSYHKKGIWFVGCTVEDFLLRSIKLLFRCVKYEFASRSLNRHAFRLCAPNFIAC